MAGDLPRSTDLADLKELIFGSIQNFKVQADEYMIKYEECCDIVLRYDEVMTQKCSKQSLADCEKDILKQLKKTEKKLNSKLEDLEI